MVSLSNHMRLYLLPLILLAALAAAILGSQLGAPVSASPAVTITRYPLNPGTSTPRGISRGPDNNVWFFESLNAGGYAIARITPSGTITDFPIPGTPALMTAGPDGNIWYTRWDSGIIGKVTPTGAVVNYPLPAGISSANGITAGPDGNLWITDQSGNKILRVTTSGQVTGQFPVPTPSSGLSQIVTGPDGNLWFIEWVAKRVGRITLSGTISEEFPIPMGDPSGITAGPDGAIWIGLFSQKYARIAPDGTVTEYPSRYGQPYAITTGSDGNLWGVNRQSAKYIEVYDIIRITPYGFETDVFSWACRNCGFAAITPGGDGNIWFTNSNDIGTFYIGTFDPRGVPPPSVFYFPFVSR